MKRTPFTQLIILYPGGGQQVVKPSASFNGDWDMLAQCIGGPYFPQNVPVKYELR